MQALNEEEVVQRNESSEVLLPQIVKSIDLEESIVSNPPKVPCKRCKSLNLMEYQFCSQCGYQFRASLPSLSSSSSLTTSQSILTEKMKKSLPIYRSHSSFASEQRGSRSLQNAKAKKNISKSKNRSNHSKLRSSTEINPEELSEKVRAALFAPLPSSTPSSSFLSDRQVLVELTGLEVQNLEVVERGYRFLNAAQCSRFIKAPEDRFPPVKLAESRDHLRQDHRYLSQDIPPITAQYQFLQQRSKLFTSSSFEQRQASAPLEAESEEEPPKAWLWGHSFLAEQRSLEDHNQSIESLQSLPPSSAAAAAAPGPILFWGNLAPLPDNSDDDQREVGAEQSRAEEEEEEEEELAAIDWTSVSSSDLELRHHHSYVTNLHVGRLFMDCYRAVKACLPALEVDPRLSPAEVDETFLAALQAAIDESEDLLQEAREFIPRAIEEELHRFELFSKRCRYSIASDISSGLQEMARRESDYRLRFQQEKQRIESSASDYILENALLLHKFLEESSELQRIESEAKETLELLGGQVQFLVDLETRMVSALQQEDFAARETVRHWQPRFEQTIASLDLAKKRAQAWLNLPE